MNKEVECISVTYSDGSKKEIMSGCCVDFCKSENELTVEMLNCAPGDLIDLTIGMLACVEKLGMREDLIAHVDKTSEGGKSDAEDL